VNILTGARFRRHLAGARDERGQGILEFALVAPLLFALVGAIFQFGIVFNDWITLTRAVGAGGRAAAVCRFNPGADPVAVIQAAAPDATVTPASFSCPGQAYVQVTMSASVPYGIEIPFIGTIKAGNLTASTTESTE
jgi:Flp pilus assembly protein TadG